MGEVGEPGSGAPLLCRSSPGPVLWTVPRPARGSVERNLLLVRGSPGFSARPDDFPRCVPPDPSPLSFAGRDLGDPAMTLEDMVHRSPEKLSPQAGPMMGEASPGFAEALKMQGSRGSLQSGNPAGLPPIPGTSKDHRPCAPHRTNGHCP